MEKRCGLDKKDLMKWIDGELEGNKAAVVAGHLEGCAPCQKEAEAFRRLNGSLRNLQTNIEVSRGFETAFWAKVSQRQSSPWLVRLLNGLEALVPVPNLRQAVAFSILAFFIGNMGGITTTLRQDAFASKLTVSMEHFSGVQEFKGIAPYSLAGAYLSTVENEVFK